MYVGRIVAVGKLWDGRLGAMYRVSSRSFPNRSAAVSGIDAVKILPRTGHEGDVHKNPYIAYNCIRVVCDGEVAVVSNGGQTDAIAEKMAQGMSARDALTLAHMTLDYEKDQYNTPRISGVVDKVDGAAWLAVVREDGLEVRRMPLSAGHFMYVTTYEENSLDEERAGTFDIDNAENGCRLVLAGGVFATRDHPVTAAAALATEAGFELAAQDAEPATTR